MASTVAERNELWREFLERWPLQGLTNMSLADYSQVGQKDSFTYWLESKTEELGSIWGGSSFKFGVYSRKDQSDRPSGGGIEYDTNYAWLQKYGVTADAAFEKVKSIVVEIAQAARKGDLAAIEAADLGTVTKWKIAFLYQDPDSPCVLPVFKKESLQAVSDQSQNASCAQMQQALLSLRGATDLLSYGDGLLSRIRAIEQAQLSSADALEFLQSSDRFRPIKEPTSKMAGFRTEGGKELALSLDNKLQPTVFLSPGDWLSPLQTQLHNVKFYAPDKSRSSNLPANAPTLAVGGPMVRVTVPTRAVLASLCEAYDSAASEQAAEPDNKNERLFSMSNLPLNQILFGPPGTGKTYATIDAALEILDPSYLQANRNVRKALKQRFDEFEKEKRLRFVTFHQSFSYEDFVEGIRASTEGTDGDGSGAVNYSVVKGVFAELCRDARRDRKLEEHIGVREGARVWKLSIEESSGSGDTRRYCLTHGEARIGWPNTGDLRTADLADPTLKLGSKDQNSLTYFAEEMEVGDVVVCLGSRSTIQAVGVITGGYEYVPDVPSKVRKDYVHKLPVHWLATDLKFSIIKLNKGVQLTLQTVYPLTRISWPDLELALKEAGVSLAGQPASAVQPPEPYVLVIDEINRGNVSRIFGELITLIESSKRAGADESLELVLPYSRDRFSVPANVYLVGTMNTADRSLTGLDTALRRRFVFREMAPRPELLDGVEVAGVDLGDLLRVINQRIEALLDREHCLGHAYFMPLKVKPQLPLLSQIFRNQILPLLQEYFFEDWQRIQWVLNDHRKQVAEWRFVQAQTLDAADLFGDGVTVSQRRQTWLINEPAFDIAESYLHTIQSSQA